VADGALFDESVGKDPTPDTWSVAELSTHLERLLVGAFPSDVWVAGQIRNLSRSANGHVYFQLVEPAAAGVAPRAQLAVTLLAPEKQVVNAQLKRAGGAVRMVDGIEVRIAGRIRWYGPRGVLQLKMHGIDPAFTIGRLQEDKDRLLASLAEDGSLGRNGALAFPLVPLRIGLITSRGSAAHADVLAELAASGIGFTVRSVDARTQGPTCGPSVAHALSVLSADEVDIILLVRGGGARTDLAGFDTELVARAIAATPVPVLTGIGHEVDRSIADEVAHQSHKTPTAAAAAVIDHVRAFGRRVDAHASAIQRAVQRSTSVAAARLADRTQRTTRAADRTLGHASARLDRSGEQAARAARRSLARGEHRLDHAASRAIRAAPRPLVEAERRLDTAAVRARAHDPAIALARGWTITTTADGRLVRHLADAPPGTDVVTRVSDGSIRSTVSLDPRLPHTQELPP